MAAPRPQSKQIEHVCDGSGLEELFTEQVWRIDECNALHVHERFFEQVAAPAAVQLAKFLPRW